MSCCWVEAQRADEFGTAAIEMFGCLQWSANIVKVYFVSLFNRVSYLVLRAHVLIQRH